MQNKHLKKDIYKVSILEELAVIYREEGSGTRYVMESSSKITI
jgi:hypothetical protein